MSGLHTLRLLNEGFICVQGEGRDATLHFLRDAGLTEACVTRRKKRCAGNMLAFLKAKHAEDWGHWDPGRLGWHPDFDVDSVRLPEFVKAPAVESRESEKPTSSPGAGLADVMECVRAGNPESVQRAVEQLRGLSFQTHQLGFSHLLPGSEARFAEVEVAFHHQLSEALSSLGVRRLFEHQVLGIDALARGNHLVLTTSTGSGKSLVYNCAATDAMLRTPSSRALYLFPTKALAQDQLLSLRRLLGCLPNTKLLANTYDGDTPMTQRAKLRQESSVLLTNPDTLHLSMLPDHARWADFLGNLRFVVVDEAHSYTGAFGAHVAFVLRRLIRVCELYGTFPQLICCSASVSNPLRLLGDLIPLSCLGLDKITVVDKDTSAQGNRLLIIWNPLNDQPLPNVAASATKEFISSKSPSKYGRGDQDCREPLLQSLKRKRRALTALSEDDKIDKNIPAFLAGCEDKVVSFKDDGVEWLSTRRRKMAEYSSGYIPRFVEEEESPSVREADSLRSTGLFDAAAILVNLIRAGVRCLLFCPCRSLVETVHNRALTLASEAGVSPSLIAGYRGGYSAEDRRAIESSMAVGKIQGIIATNALELGVDIGSLSATIHLGFGNSTSFWQQAGRAGRGGAAALTILICLSSPADQYVGKNPEELLLCRRDHYISTANPHIIRAHLQCAAFELPLDHSFKHFKDSDLWGSAYEVNLHALICENVLHRSGGTVRTFDKRPTKSVGIRQMESDSFSLIDNNGKQLDSMDRWRAFKTVHEGSVVVLQGQHYLVSRLDLDTKIAHCSVWRPSYKTVTRCRINLNISKVLETRGCASVGLVTVQITGWNYKKVRGTEIISEHDCFLPDVITVTGALCIDISETIKVRTFQQRPTQIFMILY